MKTLPLLFYYTSTCFPMILLSVSVYWDLQRWGQNHRIVFQPSPPDSNKVRSFPTSRCLMTTERDHSGKVVGVSRLIMCPRERCHVSRSTQTGHVCRYTPIVWNPLTHTELWRNKKRWFGIKCNVVYCTYTRTSTQGEVNCFWMYL